ncbi:MAG: polysaccharide export protein [Deltaproteobacteria bacterium]|nr:polysaccharide export protein [Deltaproteobacteria bacterium]
MVPYVLILLFVVGGCSTIPHPMTPADDFLQTKTWPIQPEAKIEITVSGEPSFSKKNMEVAPDGTFTYTPLGKIPATQFTEESLRDYIVERLSKDFFHDPQVYVSVENKAKIYVLGEVKNPGLFEIQKPITVLEAVKLAGSFNDQAQRDMIRIVRNTPQGEKIKEVPLKKIDFTWIKNENIYIMPGDLIMVN